MLLAAGAGARSVLDSERLERIREGCDITIRKMMEFDPERVGSRGSHRYTFGGAPFHFGCARHWAALLDPPATLAVLAAIFESDKFRLQGIGGDFVLPGAVNYQHLHRDTQSIGAGWPAGGTVDFRDMPCPEVAVNYPMEVVPGSAVGHTLYNGVTRQIPGTQKSREPIPTIDEEPLWMKLSVTAPVPAGSALFRDHRAWHGGTPNLSKEVRAIPACYFCAPWRPNGLRTVAQRGAEKQQNTLRPLSFFV